MSETTMVACPCCGDEMDARLVVCWTCYRESNRLTPGTYRTDRETWDFTQANVDSWDRQRAERIWGGPEAERTAS